MTILKKEVLPPRQAPSGACVGNVIDIIEADKRLRASFSRAVWTCFLFLGIVLAIVRCLEMPS